MKNIVILGSTGSIGRKTLSVVEDFPVEFNVVGLACRSNVELLAEQTRRFRPEVIAVADKSKFGQLKQLVREAGISSSSGAEVRILAGEEGLAEMSGYDKAQMVVLAMVGSSGLFPLLSAIEHGKEIALANKETLVMAGELIVRKAEEKGIRILPLDSEHSAIFQCLNVHANGFFPPKKKVSPQQEVKRIILTGSGGPFITLKSSDLSAATPQQALNHPRWKMGSKISIDSATLMNKGFEVIEARWLFNIDIDRIEIVIHPEAIIHSMVEFIDGSIIAQMAVTDMYLPIQYALSYPRRFFSKLASLDFSQLKQFSFSSPDLDRFPCLGLAYQAAKIGGTMPAALNAANEELVGYFLDNKIKFTDIPRIIEKLMASHSARHEVAIGDILEVDKWARQEVRKFC